VLEGGCAAVPAALLANAAPRRGKIHHPAEGVADVSPWRTVATNGGGGCTAADDGAGGVR
jgi:hypothetical protein